MFLLKNHPFELLLDIFLVDYHLCENIFNLNSGGDGDEKPMKIVMVLLWCVYSILIVFTHKMDVAAETGISFYLWNKERAFTPIRLFRGDNDEINKASSLMKITIYSIEHSLTSIY